ncbi:MAG: endonuclease/exonuclease/phosphatase family protein [Anaerolineae bacterium]|nr:endonuclease/exonuclease/phosphatase family protein [Anaerolineae bacterium]
MSIRGLSYNRLASLIEATAVFVFFYQALRVLFSMLFGVIYDVLFAETASISTAGLLLAAVVVALLAPLAAPKRPKTLRAGSLAGAVLVFLARIPLTLDIPQIRLEAALMIIAAGGFYLASRLRVDARQAARALILALVIDQVLRAAGQSFDVTLRTGWWPGQAVVSAALCLLAGWLYRQRPKEEPAAGIRLDLRTGLAWGSWLFLETSLLAFPNALARWSSGPYLAFATCVPLVMALVLFEEEVWLALRGRIGGAALLAVLVVGLGAGYLTAGLPAFLGLVAAQVAAVVLLLSYFGPDHSDRRDRMELGLAWGGILFLILGFVWAFAFTYAYTLDIFRGIGLPVFLAAGLLAGLPGLRPAAQTGPISRSSRQRTMAMWGTALGVAALVLAVNWPRSSPQAKEGNLFRAATYNIHYGYDSDWRLQLEAQAQAIEAAEADVVALQEVDTGRPTSYMIDDARWLARRLNMGVVYMPCVEHLTGIGLLSRYPILDYDTLLLPSDLEQTGIIWAKIDVRGQPVNVFAIWMGLEPGERAQQLNAALAFIATHPGPAVFGGDFNSAPDSPVYAQISGAGFADPFVALGLGSPPTDPAIQATKRIDFVWLRDLTPVAAEVPEALASDHRLVVVEVKIP